MWQAVQEMAIAVLVLLGVWSGSVAQSEAPVSVDTEEIVDKAAATTTVAYVVDGDTVELVGGERVRLLGVDTPERDECYYEEAREHLRAAVEGKAVRLESDVTNVDDYGRLLRHIFLPTATTERHLNYELVEQGYAVVLPIPPDRAYREQFKAAERAAKAARLGRHHDCS